MAPQVLLQDWVHHLLAHKDLHPVPYDPSAELQELTQDLRVHVHPWMHLHDPTSHLRKIPRQRGAEHRHREGARSFGPGQEVRRVHKQTWEDSRGLDTGALDTDSDRVSQSRGACWTGDGVQEGVHRQPAEVHHLRLRQHTAGFAGHAAGGQRQEAAAAAQVQPPPAAARLLVEVEDAQLQQVPVQADGDAAPDPAQPGLLHQGQAEHGAEQAAVAVARHVAADGGRQEPDEGPRGGGGQGREEDRGAGRGRHGPADAVVEEREPGPGAEARPEEPQQQPQRGPHLCVLQGEVRAHRGGLLDQPGHRWFTERGVIAVSASGLDPCLLW